MKRAFQIMILDEVTGQGRSFVVHTNTDIPEHARENLIRAFHIVMESYIVHPNQVEEKS